jgi:type III pantothenate kinase
MILDIDVGNSFVKWRVSGGLGVTHRGSQATASIIKEGLDLIISGSLTQARLSSVADGSVATALHHQLADTFGVELQRAIVSAEAGGVRCGYADVTALGIDRWMAMVGAYSKLSRPLIVVDLGSAITMDVVDKVGQHLGGYILPGIALMRRSLRGGTAHVRPTDEIDQIIAPAQDTSAAVSRGSLLAVVAVIEKLVDMHQSILILTGGDARLIMSMLNIEAEYMPELVLDGLSVNDISLVKC